MAERIHFVKWTHDADGQPRQAFECRGDRDSECHRYTECGCYHSDCGHIAVPHDECGYLVYLREEDCGTECHFGKTGEKLRDGAITVEWYDECVRWSYA